MAKHRRQGTSATRRIATTAAVAATATVAVPAVAQGAEVVIPNTNYSVNVQGLENVPNIDQVPNIGRYVPSLANGNTVSAQAKYAAKVAAPAAAPAQKSAGQKVVDAVRSKVGAPYVYGAAGPSAFDCSGLTSWAYAQAGKSIPRTSQAQASAGRNIPLSQIQPGDIVVYYGGASHVAIYVGNGMMIDALNSGSPVAERPLHYMPVHSVVRF